MARIRSVKPELCTSETMALVSAEAERTFVRLWTHCDDEGRAKDHPKLLKATLFPLHDAVNAEDVDRHLDELVRHGLLVRYSVAGTRFLAVPSWHEHQKPQKRQVSKIPPPDEADELPERDQDGSGRVALPDGYGPVVEGRGEVGVVVEVGVADPAITCGQPQVVEPAPPLDVDQAVNRAVGILANLRAIGGDNPGALAAHIGRTLPDHERAELRELIATGMDPGDAAAALADPLRGLQGTGTAHDPAAVSAAQDAAKRREADTRDRLASMGSGGRTKPPSALQDALKATAVTA